MMESSEKKYLSLPKKIAYGAGDFGTNFFYMTVSAFVLIYLTDAVGLNAGIVGTLIMAAKLLDGITDVIFGRFIDRTHSKMGKARPWMFWSAFPLGLCLILLFAVPESIGETAQYAYFFIVYTAANAIFYTANNIAYATMSALITKNNTERVLLGSFRYIFAVAASVIVSAITVTLVTNFGGGAAGWRTVAIIYALISVFFLCLSSLVCKEVPESEAEIKAAKSKQKGSGGSETFFSQLKVVLGNKYYLILLVVYILLYTNNGLGSSVGVYYCTYVLGNASLLGLISLSAFVIIIGLIANPGLVKKFGMYKVNLYAYLINTILSVGLLITAYMGNLPGILVFSFLKGIAGATLFGSINALVAEVSSYTYNTKKVRADGMMFSCSSVGMKVGGGLGAAIGGWLLSIAGYIGSAEVQSTAVINAIKFGFGALPLIFTVVITICLWRLTVVQENVKYTAGAV